MKKLIYLLLPTAILLFAPSCGIFSKGDRNLLYTKKNREKAKVKKGLFSSKRVSFGNFSSTPIKKGVDNSIFSSADWQEPFYFSLSKKEGDTLKLQAVYADKTTFQYKELPPSFDKSSIKKVFYAWVINSTNYGLNNWEMILKNPSFEELDKEIPIGILSSSEDKMEIYANNRSGKIQSYDELTFEFRLTGFSVAAVQVNGDRKYVWMDPRLNAARKYALAGAMAAILLR